MMKKLLVLLLVFGITSIANAGVIDLQIVSLNGEPIDPVKEITIGQSEWIDIDIIYTAPVGTNLTQLFSEVVAAGPGTLDLSEITIPPGVWDLDPLYSPGITEVVAGSDYVLEYAYGMAGSGVIGTGAPAIAIDHILLHCDSIEGDVYVTIVDHIGAGGIGSFESTFTFPEYGPGVHVTQIPEPMTIALLGLGGLFLLRRRK